MKHRACHLFCLSFVVLLLLHHDRYSVEAQEPTLADFWSGAATFQNPQFVNTAISQFHFLSHVWNGTELRAYYISPFDNFLGEPLLDVALAVSADGFTFTDVGKVLTTGGRWEQEFDGNPDLSHGSVGRPDGTCGNGWSANVAQDSPGRRR